MNNETLPKITIPSDLKWDGCDQEDSHLHATADIFGILYHLEAIEVDQSGVAVDESNAKTLRLCHELDSGDEYEESPFATVALKPGRQYVVFFTPAWK